MINGSDPRHTDRLKYAINKLKSIIPNVEHQNILVILSNVALKPNLDIKKLLEFDIPDKHILYVDNSIFTVDYENDNESIIQEANNSYRKLTGTLNNFLKIASGMQISKTEAFVKLKEQRDELKHEIGVLLEKYKVLIEKKKLYKKSKIIFRNGMKIKQN